MSDDDGTETTRFVDRARAWLATAYDGTVELAGLEPIRVTGNGRLFGCRYTDADEPMLAAALWVPAGDGDPFPAANSAPLDEDVNFAASPGAAEPWRWRANALRCVVAMRAVVAGAPATAAAWQPADEAPGWWNRLLDEHFPEAELEVCRTWAEVAETVAAGGPGRNGVVWLRRRVEGREVTGHLLYAVLDEETGGVVLYDPQHGAPASLNDEDVEEIVLAHFHHDPARPGTPAAEPWEAAAYDFPAAVAKAESWLARTFPDGVTLVEPSPADERERGWLFACTTTRFLETEDWRDQMLDAALLVPKATGQSPFGLPNRDPWAWLAAWDRDEPGLPPVPAPGLASWFGAMAERIPGLATSEPEPHRHWAEALQEIGDLPEGGVALVWVRRRDDRGRETVGHLLWAVHRRGRVEVFDSTAGAGAPPDSVEPFELRVFRIDTSGAELAGTTGN